MKFGYVHAFVLPFPKKNLAKYKRIMKIMQKAWIRHGAMNYFQCAGDQLDEGPTTSFPKSVKLKKGEAVVLGIGLFKNKAQFLRAMKNVTADPQVAPLMNPDALNFDASRMYWGGFKPIL